MGKLYKGGLVVRTRSRHPLPSSVRDVVAGYLEVLNKAVPLAFLFGAFLLMLYLNKNGLTDVFMTAIGSPQGLIAFSIGGIFVIFSWVFLLLLPLLLATIIKSWEAEYSRIKTLELRFWFGSLMFCAAFAAIFLPNSEGYQEYKFIGWLGIAYLLLLYFFEKGWGHLWVMVLAVGCCFAVASWPIVTIIYAANFYEQDDSYALLFLFIYLLISGWLVTAILNGKNVKTLVLLSLLGGIASIFTLIYLSDFVADRAARLLGLRHDQPHWYWVSKEAAVKYVPDGMCVFNEGKESYVHAKIKFSLGDVRVLCVSRDLENPLKKMEREKTTEDVCVTLDKSEVRRVDSLHFDGRRCLKCTPQTQENKQDGSKG